MDGIGYGREGEREEEKRGIKRLKSLRPYQQKIVNDLLSAIALPDCPPLLVNASVGSGKSLVIAELLRLIPGNILCLTMSSELVRNNAETCIDQGDECGIYCAGLFKKETVQRIIFGTPHSLMADIRNAGPLAQKPIDLIIVDEAHSINHTDEDSMFMRIFHHYGDCKVIGLTGTPYRGKSVHISGEDQFFKKEICSITTSELIRDGYLVRPNFGVIVDEFNFSKLKIDSMGRFNQQELRAAASNERLTAKIMREIISVVSGGRNGAFIFASTIQHAYECLNSLPEHESAIIVGETPQKERMEAIDKARAGIIKYLVNVNCLTVGIDIPNFDVCAWLRPTESLTLYLQGIGRVLRLHPESYKQEGIVLDYAGNIDRHGDIDDPIINEAIQRRTPDDEDYCIPCYTCGELNKPTARRCIGLTPQRCDHFFNFKPCHACSLENDITSRYCRGCNAELVDPNTKLRLLPGQFICTVKDVSYKITSSQFIVIYECETQSVFESYYIANQKGRNIFYANFVRKCVHKPSSFYMHLGDSHVLEQMSKLVRKPIKIVVSVSDMKIKQKIF